MMYGNLIEKYGVDNVSKLEEVKQLKKDTCFNNYGVSNPMQRKELFEKCLLSNYKIIYYNDELFAQGTYELHFLNYCEENGILNHISHGPTLKYFLE
jgi:hypothetical protein